MVELGARRPERRIMKSRSKSRPAVPPRRRPSKTRRAAAPKLRERETPLRLALDAAQIGTFDWDIPRDRMTWSRWHEQLWGFQPREFRGTYEEFAERVHPEDLALVTAELARCRAAREPFSSEFRVVRPDGTERWVLGTGEFSFGRGGAAARMRGTVRDITERRRMEQRLRESEEKFSKAFHASPAMAAITTLDGKAVELNDAYAAFVGRSREQIVGKSAIDLKIVDADERQKLVDLVDRDGGTVRGLEVAIRTSAGARRQILFSADTITLSGVPHRLTTALDITERKQLEEALRASHDQLRSFVEHAPIPIVMFDREMRYLIRSRRWAVDFDRDIGDPIGRSLYDVHPNLPASWKGVHRQGLAGHNVRHDGASWIQADGSKRWLRWAVLPWRDVHGDIGGIIIFAEDTTLRKESERRLRHLSRRLMEAQDASRRELARELHDRIGQNLTALSLNLSIIRTHGLDQPSVMPARLNDSLNLVAETMDRVRNLMAELRPPALDDYGLAAALRWYGKLFSERSGIAVRVVADEPPMRLPAGVETALFRVAEEALTNVARHAAAHEVAITLADPAGKVRLTIADDGQGFEPPLLGGSTTWGIALMRERAEAIGGHLDIAAVRGHGTTVTVHVPRTG